MESRIVELEMKITYQERTIATLNEVVTEQRALVDELAARLDRVETRLRGFADAPTDPGDEPPPPHY